VKGIEQIQPLEGLADRWIGRWSSPDAAALAAVSGRRPAVVVTGGSEGIGLAIARQFAAQGREIVLVARREAPLAAAAEAFGRDFGRKAWPLPVDITQPDAADAIARFLEASGLYADVLVNSAGVGQAGTFAEAAVGDIERLIDLNIAALSRLMRSFLPQMVARGRGGLLNVASLGGLAPGPNQAIYYASKAYVISLTEAVAYEVRGRGVRIAVVAPGPVETAFHARMGAEAARYRHLLPADSPQFVARSAVRWFGLGRKVIVPGFASSCLAIAMRYVPHGVVVPIVGWLLALPGGRGHARRQHQ
jgi:uncharacterized protein